MFKNKSFGFKVTLFLIVLTVVTALVYAGMYNGSRYMSWNAVIVMLAGAALALVLGFTPLAKWSCCVLALADLIGALMYVYGVYFYVSIVMVGIQASSFNSQFIICTVLFVVLLVLNLINVFLKQVKEEA